MSAQEDLLTLIYLGATGTLILLGIVVLAFLTIQMWRD